MSPTIRSLIASVIGIIATGCTSFLRIEDAADKRITAAATVFLTQPNGEVLVMYGAHPESAAIRGKGIRKTVSSSRWEPFEGSVPVDRQTAIYIELVNPKRTIIGGLILLGYVLIAITFASPTTVRHLLFLTREGRRDQEHAE